MLRPLLNDIIQLVLQKIAYRAQSGETDILNEFCEGQCI